MADVRCDSRDLRVVLDALNGLLEDAESELWGAEQQAYLRLCEVAGVDPIEPFEQQSLGVLDPEQFRPSSSIMDDYIHRTREFFRHPKSPPPPPKRDAAKEIADKMARASSDAARGKPTPPPAPEPKRSLTEDEKKALREALGEEE